MTIERTQSQGKQTVNHLEGIVLPKVLTRRQALVVLAFLCGWAAAVATALKSNVAFELLVSCRTPATTLARCSRSATLQTIRVSEGNGPGTEELTLSPQHHVLLEQKCPSGLKIS
jgi:hypothetical protein